MVKKICYLFIIFFLFSSYWFSQDNIESRQSELDQIREEIKALEEELKEKSAREKETFSIIEKYSRQSFLINKIINRLRAEEKIKEKSIEKTEIEISALENDIEKLKKNYEKYIVAVYKYGKVSDLEAMINAGSVEKALMRYKYLEKFSEKRRKDLNLLRENKEKLIAARQVFEKEKREKNLLAAAKIKEENQLSEKLSERKKIINSIKNDKAELKKELLAKRDAEQKIKFMIAKLIEEAERKKEAERIAREDAEKKSLSPGIIKNETSFDVDLSTSSFNSFASLKGRLGWPVANGKIIRRFGENRNRTLNTVTLNYGVDIKTDSDVNVRSVADGVVSAIDWIPGYGSIIILTHRDNYRTVYSHLSEIFVKEGDHVTTNSVLAKVGESLEGYILHFEIWSARENQNPEIWLAKK